MVSVPLRTPLAVALAVALVALTVSCSRDQNTPPDALLPSPGAATTVAPPARGVEVYEGLGAWIDVIDYVPSTRTPGRPQP